MSFFKKLFLFQWLQTWLERPYHVFIVCSIFVIMNIIFDGTAFQMRKLYINKKILVEKSDEIQIKNNKILNILEKLKDPQYLEKEVRDRFNLAGEGDLIFIFPEDD